MVREVVAAGFVSRHSRAVTAKARTIAIGSNSPKLSITRPEITPAGTATGNVGRVPVGPTETLTTSLHCLHFHRDGREVDHPDVPIRDNRPGGTAVTSKRPSLVCLSNGRGAAERAATLLRL
jgi:hypothetical protein